MISEPERRWWSALRLRVRTLVMLVIVIGGGLGWIVHLARIQRRAVAAIANNGGFVLYDWQVKDGHFNSAPVPRWKGWLIDHLGPDYFGRVVHVSYPEFVSATSTAHGTIFVGTTAGLTSYFDLPVSNAELAHLDDLTYLESLFLNGSPITDAGLIHLKKLDNLKELWLEKTQVTDEGVRELQLVLPQARMHR
jgi:hypothetical protein